MPNDVLSFNGKYLGLFKPSTKCACLRFLAIFQISSSVSMLVSNITGGALGNQTPGALSEPIIELGLGFWLLWGLKQKNEEPILHYSFAQFLLAVKGTIDFIAYTSVALYTNNFTQFRSEIITVCFGIVTQAYYSYISWSFVVIVLRTRSSFSEDTTVRGNQGLFEVSSDLHSDLLESTERAEVDPPRISR